MVNIPAEGKIHIPWRDYTEEEILLLLQGLFETEVYDVYNAHFSDRASEKGADLLLSKNGETYAIAVKIKPAKKDIYQMIELSEREEKNKIYIHLESPTNEFKNKMGRYNNIDFWGPKKLTNEFFKRNPYFASNLVIANTELYRNLSDLQRFLIKIYFENKDKKSNSVPPKGEYWLEILWRLKDIGVVMYQVNLHLQFMFEEQFDVDLSLETNKRLLKSYLHLLNYMNNEIKPSVELLADFYEKNEEFVRYVINKTRTRSNWLHLSRFNVIVPGRVKTLFEEAKKERNAFKGIEDDFGKIEVEKEDKTNPVWAAIESNSRRLSSFGWAFEATIDYFFNYAIDVEEVVE